MFKTTFDDSQWSSDAGGFGTEGTPGGNIRTLWYTLDIWMHQKFTIGIDLSARVLDNIVMKIHHYEECEIFNNGELAGVYRGFISSYSILPINLIAKNTL